MVLGLAIAKFGGDNEAASFGAGGLLVLVGAAGVGYGTLRYRQVNREIEAERIVTASNANAAVAASVVLVVAMLAALIILVIAQA
jgi:uncharacterized membrane protein YidH (DUF202 family)